MNTTNTNGAIMAATQAAPAKLQPNPSSPSQVLNSLLNGKAIQQTLRSTLDKNSGAFVASVMNLFNNDKLLQQCEPKRVLAEALKAAALKLPVEKQLGFAYIVAYNKKIKDENGKEIWVVLPQFQLGYKGYIQLAMRTGEYRYINAGKVYEGELKGEDRLTGAVDLSGERISDEVTGYFAYIETLNGFSKAVYWTKDCVEAHAKRYSKSFKSGAWNTNFDEMAVKTVLRNLLSHYGIMSIEMSNALSDETTPGKLPDEPADSPEIVVEEITLDYSETTASESESAPDDLQ